MEPDTVAYACFDLCSQDTPNCVINTGMPLVGFGWCKTCLPKRTTEDAQDVMSVFRSMQELPVEARVSKCRRDHNHYSVPSPKALGTGIQSLAQLTLLLPTTLQHSRLNRNHISTRLRIRQPC